MQQFGGINIMSYYLPTLLMESVHLSDTMARLIAAVSSVVYFFAALAAAPLVERYGRRTMMMVSTAMQFFCFLLMTVLLYYAQKEGYPNQEKVAQASVVFFFLYYIGFGLGMLGIPWLYPTEINSLPMRTKGAAAATMSDWITNFIVVEVTPVGIQNLGWRFYIVWTVTNAAFLPILYFFYPETGEFTIYFAQGNHQGPVMNHTLTDFFEADRTLEDLDAYYREDPPLIVTRDRHAVSRRRPEKYTEMHRRDIVEAEASREKSPVELVA